MEKRTNKYRITLEQLEIANGSAINTEPLTLNIENHDELFNIIERVKQKGIFEDQQQAAEFAIGLKMFSETMLRNRKHPLFEEFSKPFRLFMEQLKSY